MKMLMAESPVALSMRTIREPDPSTRPSRSCAAMLRRWTLVQGILAPMQFLIFHRQPAARCKRYLMRRAWATKRPRSRSWSRRLALYTIMITGAVWEKDVFGRYLVRTCFLLGRRVQHAGAGVAHGVSGCALFWLVGAPRHLMLLASGCLCGLRDQRRAVRLEAASGAVAGRPLPGFTNGRGSICRA